MRGCSIQAGCTALPPLLNIKQVMLQRQCPGVWSAKDELPVSGAAGAGVTEGAWPRGQAWLWGAGPKGGVGLSDTGVSARAGPGAVEDGRGRG